GDDDVRELEGCRCRGYALRLMRVDEIRPAGRDIAKRASPRADAAEDHHRRVLLLPALADIRAGRLLAHRVERKLAHQPARRLVFGRTRRLDPQPVRLAPDRAVATMRLFGMAQTHRCVGSPVFVMPGLDPGIHGNRARPLSWIRGWPGRARP